MPSRWRSSPKSSRAQPVQRGAVELGGAADEVVHLRLERLAVAVVPGVRRDVAVVDEHLVREPVLRLARQPAAALEQQDPLARGRQATHQRAAARAAPDHDHVVGGAHVRLLQLLGDDDPGGGLDQREVRERLREVAQVPARVGVELLGVEPERRRDAQQPLHQVARAAAARRRSPAPRRARTSRSGTCPPCPTARRRSRRSCSAARSRARSARPGSRARSRAAARRRPGRKPKIAASSVEASSASVS